MHTMIILMMMIMNKRSITRTKQSLICERSLKEYYISKYSNSFSDSMHFIHGNQHVYEYNTVLTVIFTTLPMLLVITVKYNHAPLMLSRTQNATYIKWLRNTTHMQYYLWYVCQPRGAWVNIDKCLFNCESKGFM